MLTDFQNTFVGRLSGKFAIPPHLKYIAMKYLCSKNRNAEEEIEPNCHVRHSH